MMRFDVLASVLFSCAGAAPVPAAEVPAVPPAVEEVADRWDLARRHTDVLVFSTLCTAQEVKGRLATDEGIRQAIQWCRQTAVTRVYLETFRSGSLVDRATLTRAKRQLEQAGLRVSGCVTTTGLGRKSQYEAYFMMRWFGRIGGPKCGGGWFDSHDTSPAKDGPEFWDTGPDEYIFDFMGLLGLPLVPDTQVRADVQAAFLSYHALSEPNLRSKVKAMLKAGIPVLMTSTLANNLAWLDAAERKSILTIDVPSDGWSLMDMPADRLSAIRARMLEPFGIRLNAPTRVALYLLGDDGVVLENFDKRTATVDLAVAAVQAKVLLSIESARVTSDDAQGTRIEMPPHSLIAMRIH